MGIGLGTSYLGIGLGTSFLVVAIGATYLVVGISTTYLLDGIGTLGGRYRYFLHNNRELWSIESTLNNCKLLYQCQTDLTYLDLYITTVDDF